jgi:hypothetical protein
MNEIHIRFVDAAEKLPGIGRKALHIPSLSLGVKGIESKRTLARTRKTGNDHHGIPGNLQFHILQIVHPGSLDMYFLFVNGRNLIAQKYSYFALRNIFT